MVRCFDYKDIAPSLEKLFFYLGGLANCIKPGSKVLIKPNLVFNVKPDRAATTHPTVVAELVKLLIDCRCKVYVGDSPFFGKTNRWLDKTGVVKSAKNAGAVIEDFIKTVEVKVDNPVVQKSFQVAKITQEVDYIISLAKLKMHKQCVFTASVKNNYGLVVGPIKGLIHLKMKTVKRFANMLLDLYKVLPPHLGVLDGVVGMEGDGPGGGTPKNANVLGASLNPLALDWASANIVGLNPEDVDYLKIAQNRCDIDFDNLNIKLVGDDISKVDFKRATPMPINFMPKFMVNLKNLDK